MAEEEATTTDPSCTAANAHPGSVHPRLCRLKTSWHKKGAPTDVQPERAGFRSIWMRKSGLLDNQYESAIKLKVTSKAKGGDATLFLL